MIHLLPHYLLVSSPYVLACSPMNTFTIISCKACENQPPEEERPTPKRNVRNVCLSRRKSTSGMYACMYIYIYTYTYTCFMIHHIYLYTRIYIYIYIYNICIYIYMYGHVCIYTHICVYIHILYTYAYVRLSLSLYVYIIYKCWCLCVNICMWEPQFRSMSTFLQGLQSHRDTAHFHGKPWNPSSRGPATGGDWRGFDRPISAEKMG